MIEVDATAAKAITEAISQISVKVDTDRHINPLLDAAFSIMKTDFDVFMTMLSTNMPSRFHHVYEWGQIGNQDAALWETQMNGRGRSREITWAWLPSTYPVPTPDLPEGSFRPHVFAWKAPVMEYGQAVHIAARNGNVLAFPNTGPDASERPIIFTSQPVVVRNPGGDAVQGAFTATFSDWWGGEQAEIALSESITRATEKTFLKSWETHTRRIMKKTRMGTKAATITSNALAAAEAFDVSESVLNDLILSYRRHRG